MYEALTTLADVKGWLDIKAATDDTRLGALIDAISEAVGRYLGRDNLGSVETYTESYFNATSYLLLDHYPVVSIVSAGQGPVTYPVVATLTGSLPSSGVWLDRDKRTLRLFGVVGGASLHAGGGAPITVTYTAGYATPDVPAGLAQAVNMAIGEVYKSKDWIGIISKTLANESITYDQGKFGGFSQRVKAMLEPYRNRIPIMGAGA